MSGSLRLGVLDQSPISEGSTGADALANTLDLARHADALGYHRYWLAEHHGGPMLAGAAPEVLIGPVAAATTRIRVGSAGVMLPHYSPFKVAEVFSILANLYPNRIDLGLGRASGTDQVTALALQRDRGKRMPDDFAQQLAELLALLDDTMPAEHPFARLAHLPGGPARPQQWLLGSSAQSAIWAGELGLSYAFADFINPGGAVMAADYRSRFVPNERLQAPRTAVAAWVICADTEDEAQELAASSRMSLSLLRRGTLIPVPPVEKALRYLQERGEPRSGAPAGRRAIIGTPEQVRAGLETLASEYGAEEAIAVTITFDHEARRRSYTLLAEAFGLDATPPEPPNRPQA